MSDNPLGWKSARILPAFYNGVARSLAGESASCFRVTAFRFGYGFVDDAQVPTDIDTLPGVFFEGTPTMSYVDGRLMIRCHMPLKSVTEPAPYTLTGLYDQDDNLIAVAKDMPLWLSPVTLHTTYVYIDFPTVVPNPPQFFEGDCQ